MIQVVRINLCLLLDEIALSASYGVEILKARRSARPAKVVLLE